MKKQNEILEVNGFLGLNNVKIKLNKINVIIGKQGIGKSVLSKLVYFFKRIFALIFMAKLNKANNIEEYLINAFYDIFPKEYLNSNNFLIKYISYEYEIYFSGKDNTFIIKYSTKLKSVIDELDIFLNIIKDDKNVSLTNLVIESLERKRTVLSFNLYDIFIPAARSFFLNFEKIIYDIISNPLKTNIDYFFKEFGSKYKNIDKNKIIELINKDENIETKKIIEELLNGNYTKINDEDYIINKNSSLKTPIALSSSGQQEILPVIMILLNVYLSKNVNNIYIEEPEAHLFPEGQKRIVELMAVVFNNNVNTNYFITTHSPYILTSLNNLLLAHQIYSQKNITDKDKLKTEKIISKQKHIDYNDISVYTLTEKGAKDIFNKKNKLIKADYIDSVSENISKEFSKLLDLYNNDEEISDNSENNEENIND